MHIQAIATIEMLAVKNVHLLLRNIVLRCIEVLQMLDFVEFVAFARQHESEAAWHWQHVVCSVFADERHALV